MESREIHRLLPEEIIIGILSKVSVKSLFTFKSVSKSWRRLISSKYFIKTYLQNSKKNETFDHTTMIISTSSKLPDSSGGTITACSLWSLLMEPGVTHASPLDDPFSMNEYTFIVGSCNGLICVLVVDNLQFFLWNPSTRECKQLPDFFDGMNINDWKHYDIRRHGFGFDESSGDYKIYAGFEMVSIPHISVARIYSLNADSWGEVKSVIDGGSMLEIGRFVSGKLHWRSESDGEIVALDLKSETFGIVKKPNCWVYYRDWGLVVLKGCLSVYFDYPVRSDIWIQNEYGVEDSWARLLTIPYLPISNWKLLSFYDRIIPLLVLPSDEVLFTYLSIFFTCNPEDDHIRKIDYGDLIEKDRHDAHVYTESVVSLNKPRNNGIV